MFVLLGACKEAPQVSRRFFDTESRTDTPNEIRVALRNVKLLGERDINSVMDAIARTPREVSAFRHVTIYPPNDLPRFVVVEFESSSIDIVHCRDDQWHSVGVAEIRRDHKIPDLR